MDGWMHGWMDVGMHACMHAYKFNLHALLNMYVQKHTSKPTYLFIDLRRLVYLQLLLHSFLQLLTYVDVYLCT